MKLKGKFKTPLSRQINEALKIKRLKLEETLNSKSEFHKPCIKRKKYDDLQ